MAVGRWWAAQPQVVPRVLQLISGYKLGTQANAETLASCAEAVVTAPYSALSECLQAHDVPCVI